MKAPVFALAAVIAGLVAAQPALAETAAVTYDDLDLTTKEGQKELDLRIEKAARDVCGLNEKQVGSMLPTREAKACVKDARKQIEKRVASITKKETAGS